MNVELESTLEKTTNSTSDSKSGWGKSQCGFKSHLRHLTDEEGESPPTQPPEDQPMAAKSPVTEVVRSRVRSLMKEKDVSQNELARRAGMSSPALTYFFNGGDVMLNTLGKLAASLNVKPADLVRIHSPACTCEKRASEDESNGKSTPKQKPNRLTSRQLAKIRSQRPLGEIFVANVRRIMDDEAITQTELAEACGKNSSTLHGILKGEYDCSLTLAALIAKALGRNLSDLFRDS